MQGLSMNDDSAGAFEQIVRTPAPEQQQPESRESEIGSVRGRVQALQRGSAEFVAGISRGLRTPLMLLLGPLQDILDSPASKLAPDSRVVLETTRRRARGLLRLADQISDFFANAVYDAAARGPAELAALTTELAEGFRSACNWAGLELVVDCPPMSRPLLVERTTWENIVLTVVANAFRLTAEGSIEVRLREQDGQATLSVRDTGAGVTQDELARIFGRSPLGTDARDGGHDDDRIGLHMVRMLARQLNGEVGAHVESGGGSTITVRVPFTAIEPAEGPGARPAGTASPDAAKEAAIARQTGSGQRDPAAAPGARVAATQPRPASRGRIVVAEDQADMRDFIGAVLEAAGYAVDALANGTAALEACQIDPPDTLISDVAMPGMDGIQLIARLRADERTAVIPVLLLSGRTGEDSRIEGLEAGADDYLVKPLSKRELVARVDGAVRLARLRRETAQRAQADFEALFSMSPDGILVFGHDGVVLASNAQAQYLLGKGKASLSGRRIEALIPDIGLADPPAHGDVGAAAPAHAMNGPLQEFKGIHGDGSAFTAEIGLGPIYFRNRACTIAVVRDVTERKKLELERFDHEKRLGDLSRRLVEVEEGERKKLSTELHDRTSPGLAAMQINLKMLKNILPAGVSGDVSAVLDDTAALLAETTLSIREISADLRPTVLDDGGLQPALAGYAQLFSQRTGIAVHLQVTVATADLTAATQSSLFRIVQEALTNCAKHASARNVTIRLETRGSSIALSIEDDGTGFALEGLGKSGLGLLTMRERAEFIGARFSLDSLPGRGTRIQVLV
jgi:PAS domain S-box-containing protein